MLRIARAAVVLAGLLAAGAAKADARQPARRAEPARAPLAAATASIVEKFCFKCHAGKEPEADVNLKQMLTAGSVAADFKVWQKVARALEEGDMPPEDERQPSEAQRRELASAIRDRLRRVAEEQAGDPGPVVMRRLTSAEYANSLRDLTGLSLDLGRDFVSDAVGGEGFANAGGAQFMQDSTLERYLEVAKRVASHAVIGAGPLGFFRDPGKTGLELSAIDRILALDRQYGFRNAAGEGGEPFGLDRYPKAFVVAWRYRHRAALGRPRATLAELAAQEGLAPRFLEHIWSVVNDPSPSFPTSEIVTRWRKLPAPGRGGESRDVRAECDAVYRFLNVWQNQLAPNVSNQEQGVVFAEAPWTASQAHRFEFKLDLTKGAKSSQVSLAVVAVGRHQPRGPLVVWKEPRVRFRTPDTGWSPYRPLAEALPKQTAARLAFGRHVSHDGARDDVGPHDLATPAGSTSFELPFPAGSQHGELLVEAHVVRAHARSTVARAAIVRAQETNGDGKEIWAFLADPAGEAFAGWKAGALDMARKLPQISHREPAPSDRDPIPAPFDNTYNNSERNLFHTRIKYHRDDRFLVEHLVDDCARKRLDEAWTDLLSAFDYHDNFLRFLAQKYKLDLGDRDVAGLDPAWIERLPDGPRQLVRRVRDEHAAIQKTLAAAQAGHVDDLLRLAQRAWRRPLTTPEAQGLVAYYRGLRGGSGKLTHDQAIRALLARVLVAPDFLYRAERTADRPRNAVLSDFELASRLSYFLWSSPPDETLARAAEAGALRDPSRLAAEARRMLTDAKARRLATEFFGQWFGFYQFDRYGGVDPKRFPEFNDRIKAALYDEAVSFFEHIVRRDRPVDDILFADYTFLNRELAAFYGVKTGAEAGKLGAETVLVKDAARFHRGGLMGLGAILTVTSAPLRTSPVKRGDWILRRVLGTPVPPPPANVGSIAADDVQADRKTVRERLEAHRSKPACVNCHARFDPLGFALEHYDATGRWRDNYRDGEAIDDGGTLFDGTRVEGPAGLTRYFKEQRKNFHRTLCTKLVGYALGRGLQVSDQRLVDGLVEKLEGQGGQAGQGAPFSDLVAGIVTSTAFRAHRGNDDRQVVTNAAEVRAEGQKP